MQFPWLWQNLRLNSYPRSDFLPMCCRGYSTILKVSVEGDVPKSTGRGEVHKFPPRPVDSW
jgi:hypothetical protein